MQVLIDGELYEKVLIAGPSGASGPTTPENSISVVPATGQGSASVIASSDYPEGATPTNASSGNIAAGVAAATLAGVSGKTTHLCGFSVTGAGATAASVVAVTVVGLIGGTMTFNLSVPAGAAVAHGGLRLEFPKPLVASAANTAIVVSCPSLGAGNTNNATNAWGYQL